MIASFVTITDEHFGFAKTKFDKNVLDFLDDYSYRQGKITFQNKQGFTAELHSRIHSEDDTVIGHMVVIY